MEKNILGYKCQKCGTLHYPNHTRCKKCGHTEFVKEAIVYETYPMPKKGKLLTFTHLYALPPDFERVRLSLGIVELENGQRLTGQLAIENPKIGMKVEGRVEEVRKMEYSTFQGMVFYAA